MKDSNSWFSEIWCEQIFSDSLLFCINVSLLLHPSILLHPTSCLWSTSSLSWSISLPTGFFLTKFPFPFFSSVSHLYHRPTSLRIVCSLYLLSNSQFTHMTEPTQAWILSLCFLVDDSVQLLRSSRDLWPHTFDCTFHGKPLTFLGIRKVILDSPIPLCILSTLSSVPVYSLNVIASQGLS